MAQAHGDVAGQRIVVAQRAIRRQAHFVERRGAEVPDRYVIRAEFPQPLAQSLEILSPIEIRFAQDPFRVFAGEFVEVQGTAEGAAFDRTMLDALLDLGVKGCTDLTKIQQEALAR